METIAIALLGALAGGVLTYLSTLRTLYNDSVITERKNWRDEVRRLTLEAVRLSREDEFGDASLAELRYALAIRLNPGDTQDNEIIKCRFLSGESNCKCAVDEFVIKIAMLLKHDWERAKVESGFLKAWRLSAHRPTYCELINSGYNLKFRKSTWLRRNIIWIAPIAVILIAALSIPFFVESHLWPILEQWKSGYKFIFPASTLSDCAED